MRTSAICQRKFARCRASWSQVKPGPARPYFAQLLAALLAVFFLWPVNIAYAGYHEVITSADGNGYGTFRYAMNRAATEAEDSIIAIKVTGETIYLLNTFGPLPAINKSNSTYALTVSGNAVVLDGSDLLFGTGLVFNRLGFVHIANLTIQNFPESGVNFVGTVTGGLLDNVVVENNDGGGFGLSGIGVTNVQLINVAMRNSGLTHGISFSNQTSGHRIEACSISGNFTNGIFIGSNASDIHIKDCDIVSNVQNGVHIIGAGHVQVGPNNRIDVNQIGVFIEGSAAANIRVTDNISIASNVSHGLQIVNQASHIWLVNNQNIQNNGGNGILLQANPSQVRILNNQIRGNGGLAGIYANAGFNHIDIFGNTIINNSAGRGIQLSGPGSNVNIGRAGQGNTIEGHSISGSGLGGGIVSSLVSHLTIQANELQNNEIGVSISGGSNVQIGASGAGNTIQFSSFEGIIVDGVNTVTVRDTEVLNNGRSGIDVRSSSGNLMLGPNNTIHFNGVNGQGSGIVIGSSASGSIQIVDNSIRGNATRQRSGVIHRSNAASLTLLRNQIREHTVGLVSGTSSSPQYSAGVSLEAGATVVIDDDNWIAANAYGIYAIDDNINLTLTNNSDGAACNSAGIADNHFDGVAIRGGTWNIDGNCIHRNGGAGIYATLFEDGIFSTLFLGGDALSVLTLRNNDFAGNVNGGVIVEDSYVVNIGEIRSGVSGNDFSDPGGTPFGFSQRWRGVLELRYGDGAIFTESALCRWDSLVNGVTETTSQGGYCPGDIHPLNYATWPLIEELRVQADAAASVSDQVPHLPRVEYAGQVIEGDFDWDGCGPDVDQASGNNYNASIGVGAPCSGNRTRFQVARLLIYPAPTARFTKADFSQTLHSFFVPAPPTSVFIGVEVFAREIDISGDIDNAYVTIRNLRNGDEITSFPLSETAAHATLARGILEVKRSPTPVFSPPTNDNIIHCHHLDPLEVTFVNSNSPLEPKPVATSIVYCVIEADALLYFCDGPESRNEQPNQIIGTPLKACLRDLDENRNPNLIETTGAPLALSIQRQTGGTNDLTTFDALNTAATEIEPDSGLFFSTVTWFVSSNDLPFNFGDKALSCGPGDRVVAEYIDADNSGDRERYEGRCVLPPTPSSLSLKAHRYNAPSIAPINRFSQNPLNAPVDQFVTLGNKITPNMWFYVEVADANRNYSATLVDSIDAVIVENAANELDAIQRSLVVAESFDASGQRIDWIRFNLTETNAGSGVFRGIVRTSSHFGANPNFNQPNDILEVVGGGRVRVSYVDGDDPGYTSSQAAALGLQEPCPAGFDNYDCRSLTLQVIDSDFAKAVTFAGRYGHSSSQLYLPESDDLELHSVKLLLPSANRDATVPETIALGHLTVENLQTFDGFLNIVGHETDRNSGVFLFPLYVNKNNRSSTGNNVIEARHGDIVYVRIPQNPNDLNPLNWAHDTAVLCHNSPSVLQVTNPSLGPEPIDRIRLNDELLIRVYDADQNVSRAVRELITVTISSAIKQDLENIILQETDVDSGIFDRLLFFPGTGDALPGDGRVHITDKDTITIRYVDNAVKNETSPFCEQQDQVVQVYAGDSRDRLTELIFIDEQGNRIEDLRVGQPIRLQVSDIKANLDTNRRDSVTAQVFLDPERRGRPEHAGLIETVQLLETGNRSAIYQGRAASGPSLPNLAPTLAHMGPLIGSWYSARYLDKLDDPFDDIVISAPILAQPLQVTVTTRPEFGSIGDAVMVEVQIFNPNPLATLPAELLFYSFHGLSETRHSLRLRDQPVALATGRPWRLPIGQVQAYELVRMTWTAAVSPIAKGKLTAWGEVWAQDVLISERGMAEFKVVEEPLFTRSTVFLNVFQDNNGNGLQEFTEPPLEGVRIVAGDGFSVRTDARGQAHFANLEAGPDAFRIDMRSLPPGWQSTGRESQFVELLPGMLHSLSFGVRPVTETVILAPRAAPWQEATIETVVSSIPIAGSLDDKQLLVADQVYPMIEARLSLRSPAPNALFTSRIASDGFLQFNTDYDGEGIVERWLLQIFEAGGSEPIRRFAGKGVPPPELALSAEAALALLRPGRKYEVALQLKSNYGVADSGRLPFDVYLDPPKEDLGRASNFTKNEASLDPYTILALREAAMLVLNYPESTILVEGYTDDRGGIELNKRLGQRRADMAKDYLAIVEGVDPARITAIGRGAENFICPNDTEEGRACNRRVEISVFGLPSQQARVFKPSVQAPDGSQVAVTQNNRFSTQGQVQGDRLNMTVQFPSGATYFAAITVPETRVLWQPRAVVTPPDYAIPLTLVAPLGTTVSIGDRVVYMHEPTQTIVMPLVHKAALRAQFYPPSGPSMSWVGLVKLTPTLRPPSSLANLRPERFVIIELPGADVPVRSGAWTVTGSSLPGTRIVINGQSSQVGDDGRFAVPIQVGSGDNFYLDVTAAHPAGLDVQLQKSWPIENRHVLAVGVAQLSSEQKRHADYGTGQRTVGWEHRGYGRFYVEGELPGEVLLKARFRSDDRPLKTYLPDLLKYNGPAEDLIDPSRTYLVYGDDSTSTDEAPAEGPIMLLLAWNDQLLEIGTIELDERPSAIDSRSELSYGAHVRLSSAPLAPSAPTRLDGFGTRPNSARAQDRFAATGGLVYYLRHADVQEGSERLWVEEEDSISGFRQTLRTLKYGEDYTIDYLSGRIWLINPVALAGPGATVVRDSALGFNNRWIVASYRYRPSNLIDASGHGEMLRQDLGRWGELGVLYREEEVDTSLQRRGRTWIEVNPNTDTTLEFEAGRRWGAVEEYAVSLDGGLTFAVTAQTQADPANAFAAGGRTRVGRFELSANGRHLDQGYGGLRYSSAQTIDAGSLGVVYDITDRAKIGWRGDITQIGDSSDAQDRVFATHPVGPVEMTYEMRHQLYQPPLGDHHRLDGGIRAVYPIPPHWTVYGEHQQEFYQRGILAGDSLERRSTIGAGYAFSTTWNTFAEASEGNRERGGRIGGGYGNERQRLMVSYGIMQNILGDYLFGVVGAGAQQQVGSRTTLSGAQEFRHGDRERGTATILGSQFLLLQGLTVGAEAERGHFVYGDEDQAITRTAARGRVLGRVNEHRLEARGGWHLQERPGYDLMGFSTDDSWRMRFLKSAESMLRFRFARDVTRPAGDIEAEFQEYAAGLAYRPIQHNRLQLLSVVSWAKERLTPMLDPSRSLMVASIGSIDASVRLAKQLEVGGKLAGKRSGVEFEGFKSEPIHTLLSAARVAWIFFEPFDLLGEYRVWKQWETDQLLHGPLAELGVRMLPDDWQANLRFGMGYNFTTFRDELRPHDRFDAEGFRLRLMGLF